MLSSIERIRDMLMKAKHLQGTVYSYALANKIYFVLNLEDSFIETMT